MISGSPKAQDYRPMLSDGAEWYAYWFGPGLSFTAKDWVEKDTVIEGVQLYKNYNSLSTFGSGLYLSEDTVSRKVYYYREELGKINLESKGILYDFSLQIGDTVIFDQFASFESDSLRLDSITYRVESLGCLNDTSHFKYDSVRIFCLSSISDYFGEQNNIRWIEGTGSNNSLFRPHLEAESCFELGQNGVLTCHIKDGNNVFQRSYWGREACVETYGLSIEKKKVPSSFIYPNPTSGELKLELDFLESKSDFKLEIYNAISTLLFSQEYKPTYELHLSMSEYPPGLYTIRIITEQSTFYQKIILRR